MIKPPPHTEVTYDPDKCWGLEDRNLRLIEQLGRRLNEPTSMTFDERRDWANWIQQCLIENAFEIEA